MKDNERGKKILDKSGELNSEDFELQIVLT